MPRWKHWRLNQSCQLALAVVGIDHSSSPSWVLRSARSDTLSVTHVRVFLYLPSQHLVLLLVLSFGSVVHRIHPRSLFSDAPRLFLVMSGYFRAVSVDLSQGIYKWVFGVGMHCSVAQVVSSTLVLLVICTVSTSTCGGPTCCRGLDPLTVQSARADQISSSSFVPFRSVPQRPIGSIVYRH